MRAAGSDVILLLMTESILQVEREVEELEKEAAAHSHNHSHDHDHSHECTEPGCTDASHDHSHAHSHDHDHSQAHSHGHSHGEEECSEPGCTDPTHNHGDGHAHVHHKNIHDDGVTSASFVIDGAMDLAKLNLWLGALLEMRGDDIYRMKGILNIKHNKERFVFQVRGALGSRSQRWHATPNTLSDWQRRHALVVRLQCSGQL